MHRAFHVQIGLIWLKFYYWIKTVSHAINSHVLTGTSLCIDKAVHVLLIHSFVALRISISGPSQNLTPPAVTCTVAKLMLWRQDEVIICPGSGVFKSFACNVPFRTVVGTGKKNFTKHFLQSFRVTKWFYEIIVIKHVFLIHSHLLGPSGPSCSGPSRC